MSSFPAVLFKESKISCRRIILGHLVRIHLLKEIFIKIEVCRSINLKTIVPLSLCCSVLWIATIFLFMLFSVIVMHRWTNIFQIKQNTTIVLLVFWCMLLFRRALILLIISINDVTVKVASGPAAVQ